MNERYNNMNIEDSDFKDFSNDDYNSIEDDLNRTHGSN